MAGGPILLAIIVAQRQLPARGLWGTLLDTPERAELGPGGPF